MVKKLWGMNKIACCSFGCSLNKILKEQTGEGFEPTKNRFGVNGLICH
jgi:hypothetical protein